MDGGNKRNKRKRSPPLLLCQRLCRSCFQAYDQAELKLQGHAPALRGEKKLSLTTANILKEPTSITIILV